jgi:hypothetical protein
MKLFTRAGLALGLAIYGWVMLGVDLFLHLRALPPEQPDLGLAMFRRVVMGRAVWILGAGVALAAIVLAVQAIRRSQRRPGAIALVAALAWIPAAIAIFFL